MRFAILTTERCTFQQQYSHSGMPVPPLSSSRTFSSAPNGVPMSHILRCAQPLDLLRPSICVGIKKTKQQQKKRQGLPFKNKPRRMLKCGPQSSPQCHPSFQNSCFPPAAPVPGRMPESPSVRFFIACFYLYSCIFDSFSDFFFFFINMGFSCLQPSVTQLFACLL